MSLDAASEFLIRRDKKVLQKRFKGEPTLSVVQARLEDRIGLLGASSKRLVFVAKKRFGYQKLEVGKAEVAALEEQKGRVGAVVLRTKDGRTLRFEMLQNGAERAFIEKTTKGSIQTGSSRQTRAGGPMEFKPKARPVTFSQTKAPAARREVHDPLTASRQQKLDRLERLHQKGRITEAEYRWQKDALERA